MRPEAAGTAWLCCQLGAREHYSIPRALHRHVALAALITDIWAPPSNPAWRLFPRRFRERYHRDLADAPVIGMNARALATEARRWARGERDWVAVMRRNAWFQEQLPRQLERAAPAGKRGARNGLFAFSYAAAAALDFARSRGWPAILGQIDPGPAEHRIVERLHRERPDLAGPYLGPAEAYWANWRRECALADRILVNSEWSRSALVTEGVDAGRIYVAPVAYEPPPAAASFDRRYPQRFARDRPLRVLFLGQVNLRKGLSPLIDAIRELAPEDRVSFTIAGPVQIRIPDDLQASARVRWLGSVARGEVQGLYREADVFLFPTFSDGFGLTQLEAQGWKLPVIASRNCAEVVRDGVNGVLLHELTGKSIADAIKALLDEPRELARMSANSRIGPDYGLDAISAHFGRMLPA